MFDLERFIDDCVRAKDEGENQRAVCEVMKQAIVNTGEIVSALGEPQEAGFKALYESDDLTILNFTWSPMMTLMPHDHNMWAVIGLFTGREDSILWKRTEDTIEACGAKSLAPGEVGTLGPAAIHSVTNPTGKLTSALHVYGGNFFAPGRHEWDPESLEERPFDFDKSRRIFREANERFSFQ